MKINDIYSYDNSNIQNSLKVTEGAAALNANVGDIIEGTVSSIGRDETKVTFQNGSKELSFPKDSIKNAYSGETRLFEVVGRDKDKLILKDLGGAAQDIKARAAMHTTVDTQLVPMVNDFAETNGSKEEEDESSIEHLTPEDYTDLREEGFSIEKFKAERLVRAIDRIKQNRAARKNSIKAQEQELEAERDAVRERAAKAVSEKYSANMDIVDRLLEADIPVTDANIASILGAIKMSGVTSMMTENSFAYMIRNELAPSVKNIYTSVYSGMVRKGSIDDSSWDQLKNAAGTIVEEANETLGERELASEMSNAADNDAAAISGTELLPATEDDAKWLLEYDIPLNKENLVYKKELEELKTNGRKENDTASAAARALARGEKAEDAILISSFEDKTVPERTIGELTSMLRLQEIRLSMTVESRSFAGIDRGINDITALENEIAGLRDRIRAFYDDLAREIGADSSSVDTAINTAGVIEDIREAPLSLYAQTFSVRTQITLEGLGDAAAQLRMRSLASQSGSTVTLRALGSYEASATEIRADLGDSIRKAFDNADTLIADAGLDITEANRRAVRILGFNSMEITAQSIEDMKYYDAKLTTMVEGMKPSVVMSMIRRGFNPLEHDIDSINDEIAKIREEEGYSAEQRFSEFLVKLEADSAISESERNAYIGIYRLLYQIEKNDGAAIGAAIRSGRKLTLSNLLTEARTRVSGIDASIDDETDIRETGFVNSITDQIENGFTFRQTQEFIYNRNLAGMAAEITEPETWSEVIGKEGFEEYTLEQVTELLQNADKHYDGSAQLAAAVRTILSSGSVQRRFLKDLGIDDSKNNVEAFENDPALPIGTKDELLDALESADSMNEIFEAAREQTAKDAELEFIGSIAILSRGRELEEQLARYDLLGQMAGHEHYRMSVTEGGAPARINLTVIRNSGDAGTVSLEVSTSDYRLKADLSITMYSSAPEAGAGRVTGRIDGRISTDSISELRAIETPLSAFITAMKDEGYDTAGIASGADMIPENRYLGRIGELSRRAQGDTQDMLRRSRREVSTDRLYRVAKSFLSFFL